MITQPRPTKRTKGAVRSTSPAAAAEGGSSAEVAHQKEHANRRQQEVEADFQVHRPAHVAQQRGQRYRDVGWRIQHRGLADGEVSTAVVLVEIQLRQFSMVDHRADVVDVGGQVVGGVVVAQEEERLDLLQVEQKGEARQHHAGDPASVVRRPLQRRLVLRRVGRLFGHRLGLDRSGHGARAYQPVDW